MNCLRCHRPAKLASDGSGDWFCYRCGCWCTTRRDTEPSPALETFALPKPAPLRSDYEKNYGQGPSAFDAHMKLEAQGYTGPMPLPPEFYGTCEGALADVQTNWEKHCRRILVSDSGPSLYEIGLSGYNDSFRAALHRAVAEVQRKVERIVTDNHLTEATYEITADENDTGKLNITVRGRRVL